MKLLILGGPHIPAETLAPLLGRYFDVVTVTPQQASEAILRPEATAVLAEAGDLLPLGRDLIGRQSAQLLNAIGEGVCLCKPDGEVVWENDRFRAINRSLQGRVSAACAAAVKRLAIGEDPVDDGSIARLSPRRAEIASAEGDRFFEISLSPVAPDVGAEPGDAQRYVAVVWDVTPARRTQQKIESIDRAGRELMRLEADSIRKMNAGERLGFLQDKIAEYARELLHFDHFTVRLLDRESGELNLVMAVGLPQTWKAPELKAAADGQGIVGHVATTGQSYICNDTSKDRRYRQGLTSGGSSLTAPLLLHDRVIGVFNVESAKPNAFTDDDRRFAEIFARYIAMALHILDLLVVERFTTNEAVSGRVEGEVTEPLDDLAIEAEWLKRQAASDPETARHVERVLRDVESIRRRIRDVARGPRTILGAEKALREEGIDPLLVGKHILVADDEEAIRETIRDVLERRGCMVTMHKDGAGAIACLEEAAQAHGSRPASDECALPFNLIISDIKMPDHNGYEVFAAAKLLSPALPVILMTGFGYDPHHSIVRASQEGLQCVLFKPFQVERLLDEVRKAVAATPSAKT